MSIAALPNGRDLGGIRTRSGAAVASGLLFRSAAPTEPAHAAALDALAVSDVYDLRTAAEREHRPAAVPAASRVRTADLLADEPEDGPATLGRIATAALSPQERNVTARDLRAIFLHGYRSFVTLSSSRRETGRLLVDLAEPAAGPVLIHCTAGKDRTGWVAALVLLSLNVDIDDVMSDYLASGPEVAALFAPYRELVEAEGGDVSGLDVALAVFPEYLEASLAAMAAEFGSLDRYLTSGLGLPADFRERLARRLLVGAAAKARPVPRTLDP